MSELLDAFDDAGLLDFETRSFLVEALVNAEASDWRDVLEPFISPAEPALAALEKVPGVLEKSQRALDKEVTQQEKPMVSFVADAFLRALPNGVLASCGLHAVIRCAMLCRAARTHALEDELWQHRTEWAWAHWSLPPTALPNGNDKSWRQRFFLTLRPRCDGIYVGECRFRRWVRLGHHADLRKNSETLAAYGGRGGCGEWLRYRRYMRLLPPDPTDRSLWALVLTDHCPRDAAEKVLISGVDVRVHANPAKSDGVPSDPSQIGLTDPERLRKRICVGRYAYTAGPGSGEGRISINYSATDGEYQLTLLLSHGGKHVFSDCLTWESYSLVSSANGGDTTNFNLGRLPDWKGGGLSDENKDHFPQIKFRPKVALEHLL